MFLRIWFGYKYLTTAIVYLVENIEKDVSMNEIYDVLNKKHNVKRTKAERDMRYIILTEEELKNKQDEINKKIENYHARL